MSSLSSFASDIAFATRTLRRSPGFAITAIVTVALGIGASTAIFSMVNGVLLRRLPYGGGERLIHVTQSSARSPDEGFSVLEVHDLGEQAQSLAGVAEYHSMAFELYGHGDPMRVQTGVVSDDFFSLLGVEPLLGRLFRPGEEAVGAPPVLLLSHRFWIEKFGGDSSVIGSALTMNDRVHTVVGVLPPLPSYPDDNDVWMPAGACPFRSAPQMMSSRSMRMVGAWAVLKPGATLEQGRAELASVERHLHQEYPEAYPASARLRIAAIPVREELTSRSKPLLLTLLGTAAFLLLVATANLANLTLARQLRRGQELALRAALGAGSWRIFRQLAAESLVITTVGGILGALLAFSGIGMLRALASLVTPLAGEIGVDARVLLFATAVSVVVALLVAIPPLVHTRRLASLSDALREGGRNASGGQREGRLRSALLAAQVAIAFVLLVGAGLIGRSLLALQRVDPGFDASGVVTARLDLNFTSYATRAARVNMADALLERLSSMPGASSAALANALPLDNSQPSLVTFEIDGLSTPDGRASPRADLVAVSPRYFQTVGVPLLRGRTFTTSDRDTLDPVAVIGQRLARSYWGGNDPIGTRISADSGRHWVRIVGVVGDVRQSRLDQDATDEIYLPISLAAPGDLRVFLRTTGSAASLLSRFRSAVRALDPNQAVTSVQTLDQLRGSQLAEPRLTASLLMVFALVALIITAAGLTAVIAHTVNQRRPEIAIRVALGADNGRVLRLVLHQGATVVVIGLLIGTGVALAASRFVSALLFHVSPTDLVTYLSVVAIILCTAAGACLAPARRALRTDPARLLRSS